MHADDKNRNAKLPRKTTFAEAHADMSRYLEEDCYCPGEIYDTSGFFYMVVKPDEECVLCEQTDGMTVVTTVDEDDAQAIIFWHDDPEHVGRIINAKRVDATENNIGILCDIARGKKPDGRKIDEFVPGHSRTNVEKLLSIADAIICD